MSSQTRRLALLRRGLHRSYLCRLGGRYPHPLLLQSHASCRLLKRIELHRPRELLARASGNRRQVRCRPCHERHCPLPQSALNIRPKSAKKQGLLRLMQGIAELDGKDGGTGREVF